MIYDLKRSVCVKWLFDTLLHSSLEDLVELSFLAFDSWKIEELNHDIDGKYMTVLAHVTEMLYDGVVFGLFTARKGDIIVK